MLTPRQLEQIPKSMVELYSQVEIEIIADMAKRIAAFKDFIPAAEWQYMKLIEMGAMHEEIVKKLSKVMNITRNELYEIMQEAGMQAIKRDIEIYAKTGLDPTKAISNLQAVLEAGIRNTEGLFSNLTRTTANSAARQFEHALDLSWMQINTGAFSPTEAVRQSIKTLTDRGLEVIRYSSGHTDYLDVAVRRAVLTGVNQSALRMQETLADEFGSDLVEVTAHAGARVGEGVANHAGWQGKIYSRSGTSTKYPSLRDATGYGSGTGLGGWNCRHSFYPYLENVTEPTYTEAELEKLNAPMYEYKGKKLTEYEATQTQRAIERKIRKYKRELMGMKAAGLPTDSAKAKLKQWHDTQTRFLEQTGLKRQYDREK